MVHRLPDRSAEHPSRRPRGRAGRQAEMRRAPRVRRAPRAPAPAAGATASTRSRGHPRNRWTRNPSHRPAAFAAESRAAQLTLATPGSARCGRRSTWRRMQGQGARRPPRPPRRRGRGRAEIRPASRGPRARLRSRTRPVDGKASTRSCERRGSWRPRMRLRPGARACGRSKATRFRRGRLRAEACLRAKRVDPHDRHPPKTRAKAAHAPTIRAQHYVRLPTLPTTAMGSGSFPAGKVALTSRGTSRRGRRPVLT